jgi:hypothetical protein
VSSSTERGALGPEVEALQAPPPAPPDRWQENLFFICWDDAADTGLLLHVQRVPGRGEQEARVVVVVDGAVASATLTGDYGPHPVPEVALEPVEPFRRWRVGVDAKLAAGAGPLGLLTTTGPGDVPVEVELDLTSALPVVDFAGALDDIVGHLEAHGDGPQMGRQEHYEQGGRWTGTLRVGDREAQAQGLFVRDHSWGVRSEQQRFEAFWTASCLDHGTVFANAIGIPSGGRVVGVGAVADRDGVRWTTEVAASFLPMPGLATYDEVAVTYGLGIDRTLVARTRRHVPIPLPHSGRGRYDSNAISSVRMGDSHGFGVMEWAATFTEADRGAAGPAAEGGPWS